MHKFGSSSRLIKFEPPVYWFVHTFSSLNTQTPLRCLRITWVYGGRIKNIAWWNVVHVWERLRKSMAIWTDSVHDCTAAYRSCALAIIITRFIKYVFYRNASWVQAACRKSNCVTLNLATNFLSFRHRSTIAATTSTHWNVESSFLQRTCFKHIKSAINTFIQTDFELASYDTSFILGNRLGIFPEYYQ